MAQPLLVILGIIVTGAVVIFPVGLATFYRYRNRKVIICPGTHGSAGVQLNARRTALTTVFGRPLLAVQNCSLWPRKKGCDEACVKQNWPEP